MKRRAFLLERESRLPEMIGCMRAGIVMLVAMAMLSACGDGHGGFGELPQPPESGSSPSPGAAPPATIARMVPVTAGPGLEFDRDSLSLDRGEVVTFVFRNVGDRQHTFTVNEMNLQMAANAGETVRLTVEVPHALEGRFSFYCAIPGHRPAGMEGTLIIR
jgi:uncharacterized cupredoxin-like copper-binding protein